MLIWEIIGIVFVVAFGALIVGRRLRANVFSVLLVAGILGAAVAVTVVQVHQYRYEQASSEVVGASQPAAADAPTAGPPAADRSWQASSPMVKPPTGAAAPSAAPSPEFNR